MKRRAHNRKMELVKENIEGKGKKKVFFARLYLSGAANRGSTYSQKRMRSRRVRARLGGNKSARLDNDAPTLESEELALGAGDAAIYGCRSSEIWP